MRDGHHRVSVAHALGLETIEASVTEVLTHIEADPDIIDRIRQSR